MKYDCRDCKKFVETFTFTNKGEMIYIGHRCQIDTDVKDGTEAQSCYQYEYCPVVRKLPDQTKPAELLVTLKTEINYLKNLIAEIEEFYQEKNTKS